MVGYDYDKEFIEKGIEYSGIDLRHGGISEAVNDGNKYDIVILRHVLEHFLNPVEELSQLRNLISDEGVLFIEVPGVFNLKYWSYDPVKYFDIFHPFSFSLNTLTMLLNNSGFTLVEGNEHIYSIWKLSNEFEINNKSSANEYLKIKKHLLDSEKQRRRIDRFNKSFVGKLYRYSSNIIKAACK